LESGVDGDSSPDGESGEKEEGMSIKRRAVLALSFFALAAGVVGVGSAMADPVNHFGTFSAQCGSDTLVLVAKPGSSNILTINGVPTNSVSILMGITVTVDGVVVEEFHKPYTQNQQVTVCDEIDPGPGTTIVVEVLNTPPGK
jgi:hypothetical protein